MATDRSEARRGRGNRVRYKLKKYGGGRLRLSVFRSARHISAQIIDDARGHTLVCASTQDIEIRESLRHGGNKEAAAKVGELLAGRAKAASITEVVFDRGGFLYHGRIKVLADAARGAGLEF
ncbi:MAG: 50S ribosomal protein L18 [Magnetococcales bacterium]|nr:50S ribosomal protein L18 [Magnetococcales bacterium]